MNQNFSSSYYNFTLHLYIVYELNNCPNNLGNNFKLIFFFGIFKLIIDTIKSKFTYNSWGIIFDGADELRYFKDFAENVIIFGVDNSSSNDTDNLRKTLLVSCKGLALVLGLELVLILLKQIQNLIWI